MKIFKIFILLSIVFLHHAQAQVFVSASATGLGNGSSWTNAYTNLQNAINAAKSGQEIWVKSGTYFPSRDRNGTIPTNPRDATFVLKEGIKLYGGFAGAETSLSERNPETNTTILSGDIGVKNDETDNIYTLLLCVDLTSSSRLDGFTVTKANNNRTSGAITIASYIVYHNTGGAGWILSSDIIITNNKFIGNKSNSSTGGLSILYGSNLTFANNVFMGNESVNQAGAIYSSGSSVSFDNCIFLQNFAGQGAAAYIVNNGVSGFISNCTFTDNKSKADGGALLFYSSDPLLRNEIKITDSKFDKNTCVPGGVLNGLITISTRGGAIHAERTNLNIVRCDFTNQIINSLSSGVAMGGAISLGYDTSTKIDKCNFINNSIIPSNRGNSGSGGAIFALSDIEISNCIFAGNHSAGSSGALSLTSVPSTKNRIAVSNSVFTQNTAELYAGAISYGTNASSYPVGFTNLTFHANKAKLQGGAIYLNWGISDAQRTTQLQNCVFEDNSINEIAFSQASQSAYLLATNNRYHTENFSGLLFNDATNPIGKDGIWRTIDDGLRINACSIVADAGTNAALILPGTKNLWTQNDVDIVGNKRVKGENVDLGAYESDASTKPELTNSLPAIVVNTGAKQIVINLDDYFSSTVGNKNTYSITNGNPESGLYQAIITDNILTISFHETLSGSSQINFSILSACGLSSNETISVIITPSLSTEDVTMDRSLFLYPNPVESTLMISGSTPIDSYEIINMLGQTIKKSSFDLRQADVKNLTTGIYYIIINSDNKIHKFKFYKK
ncbi:T9SS type A sorting domain-containing protein [Flavobacterium hydatis]|uniref:T9SS C-terminal target domain-containing protein n=1 Tax=Flavobacterium hydatis TaxID=991 RepID=A0A086A5L2_FLAHY|nr:T9SS type A sorting domain-containing protein [Flavobacterium hydatis]KFF11976.1 hypothetical protein IW20_18965 [Flavobacterium hydatis]OXA93907.1 T9SS C-terminal target domain-containing protein [Flavobacterium hydatis]